MNIPADLRYTRNHEWIRAETDGTISVGITDHAVLCLWDAREYPATGGR